MKFSTPQNLLLTLVFLGIGLVAVGCNSSASPNPGATQATRPAQQGYGRAPHQPLAATQARVQIQQGYGHAPHQPLAATQARVQIQQGYGHAPYPPVGSMHIDQKFVSE